MRTLDSVSRCTVWIRSLQASLEEVNAHFGMDLKARLRFDPEEMEGGADNGETDPAGPGELAAANE